MFRILSVSIELIRGVYRCGFHGKITVEIKSGRTSGIIVIYVSGGVREWEVI